ncbi:MAG: hypothetical protein LBV73_03080 [Paraburkholderia sp.]|jgi:hypothetical protein|nr:hypothetical protein [Paraburkholderia sp.]
METRIERADTPLSITDFRLVDLRVKSISADRFTNDDEDSDEGGATHVKISANASVPVKKKNTKPSDMAVVEFVVTLDGFNGDGREEKDRAFTASITAEFFFKSQTEGFVNEKDVPPLVHSFAMQAMPVMMSKARGIAFDMGFPGVDPDMGLPPATLPSIEASETRKRPSGGRRKPKA